jgi:hypothetical protein
MQNLHQPTRNQEMLCAVRSSKDEQLLRRQFLLKKQEYERGGRLNVKIYVLNYGDNWWTVALVRQMKFGTKKDHGIMDIPTTLFESLFCLTKILNMATVRSYQVMLVQTLNPLSRIMWCCSLLCLCKLFNSLNNARETGELLLSRSSCLT